MNINNTFNCWNYTGSVYTNKNLRLITSEYNILDHPEAIKPEA